MKSVLLLSFTPSVVWAEKFYMERSSGSTPLIRVRVPGAENNPQRLLFDTGSRHSFLLDHNMMRSLPRAGELTGYREIAGMRGSLIPEAELASFDAHEINYVEFSGLVLTRWTHKLLRIATHEWNQKLGVAVLPESELSRWDPNDSGIIGAGPKSRFAQAHSHFGIKPRWGGAELDLFLNEPINPEWCRDGRIVYAPANEYWVFESATISLGSVEIVIGWGNTILPDTGNSCLRLPPLLYDEFLWRLQYLNIPSLQLPDGDGIKAPRIEYQHLSLIPDLIVTLISGATITIPKDIFCRCNVSGHCFVLFTKSSHFHRKITMGVELFESLIVEFDSSTPDHPRIGFCEPVDEPRSSPLVTSPSRDDIPSQPIETPLRRDDLLPATPVDTTGDAPIQTSPRHDTPPPAPIEAVVDLSTGVASPRRIDPLPATSIDTTGDAPNRTSQRRDIPPSASSDAAVQARPVDAPPRSRSNVIPSPSTTAIDTTRDAPIASSPRHESSKSGVAFEADVVARLFYEPLRLPDDIVEGPDTDDEQQDSDAKHVKPDTNHKEADRKSVQVHVMSVPAVILFCLLAI